MKKLGQRGFGAGEAIVIVVIIVALVGVGWFVWNKQKDKNKGSDSHTSSQNANDPNKQSQNPSFSLPANYTSYNDSKYGFTLAYPESWGKLSDPDDPMQRGFTMITPYIDNQPIELAWVQGRFGYAVANKKDFRVDAQKYGPAVQFSTHNGLPVWRVVDQTDDTGYKVGDNYPVKSSKNVNGITVYEFHWTDEGATHARWVFETRDKFVTISLPAILRPEMAPVSESELKTYFEIASNIRNSIKLDQ